MRRRTHAEHWEIASAKSRTNMAPNLHMDSHRLKAIEPGCIQRPWIRRKSYGISDAVVSRNPVRERSHQTRNRAWSRFPLRRALVGRRLPVHSALHIHDSDG